MLWRALELRCRSELSHIEARGPGLCIPGPSVIGMGRMTGDTVPYDGGIPQQGMQL